MSKAIRVLALSVALACPVFADDIPYGVRATGDIPFNVTAAGEIQNGVTTEGEIPNNVTLLSLLLILL